MGVVAFGGNGLATKEATTDRAAVLAAIDRLGPEGGTALACGVQTALGAIVGRPVLLDGPGTPGASGVEPQGPDLGYHGSSAIVLLSDGENTGEPDPIELADLASSAGVRIYPVGLGRPEGTVLEIDGFQVATALDEPCSARSRHGRPAGTSWRPTSRRWRPSTTPSSWPGRWRPSTSSSRPCLPPRPRCCCS